jgi:conjugal transfer/entry exclusion protein
MRKLDLKGNISTTSIQICAYADNVLIIARSEQAVNETFNKLKEEVQKLGLLINKNKKSSSFCFLSIASSKASSPKSVF